MRTLTYVARLLGQSFHYGLSSRRIMLLILLLVAPLLVLLAALIGASSPFLVYPFI